MESELNMPRLEALFLGENDWVDNILPDLDRTSPDDYEGNIVEYIMSRNPAHDNNLHSLMLQDLQDLYKYLIQLTPSNLYMYYASRFNHIYFKEIQNFFQPGDTYFLIKTYLILMQNLYDRGMYSLSCITRFTKIFNSNLDRIYKESL